MSEHTADHDARRVPDYHAVACTCGAGVGEECEAPWGKANGAVHPDRILAWEDSSRQTRPIPPD